MSSSKRKEKFKLLSVRREFNHVKAGEFLKGLKSALKKGTGVEIDLREIDSVDLTSLQLLIAARKSFENAGIPFQIRFECSEEVFLLICKCGMAEKTGAIST